MRFTSHLSVVVIALVLSAIAADSAFSQTRTLYKTVSEGEVFMLDELGALVISTDGKLTIDMIMGPEQRPKDYRDVDLIKNDVIAMANGKRLKTVADFEEMYKNLAVGDELKLGIKRGEEMRMVAFKKADPDKLPAKRMMTMKLEGDPSEDMNAEGGGMLKLDGAAGDVIPLLELGLLLSATDAGITVMKSLPNVSDVFGDTVIKDGDVLATINGKSIADKAAFNKAFEAVEIGQNITFGFVRGDKTFKAEAVKPEPTAEVIIEN